MRPVIFIVAGALLCAGGATGLQRGHSKAPKAKLHLFREVQPILRICAQCHKPPRPAHGLDLTTYAALMKGDRKGPVVVAGNLAKSRLATVLHGKPQLMPPGGELGKSDVAKVEAWIRSRAREK